MGLFGGSKHKAPHYNKNLEDLKKGDKIIVAEFIPDLFPRLFTVEKVEWAIALCITTTTGDEYIVDEENASRPNGKAILYRKSKQITRYIAVEGADVNNLWE